MNRVSFRIAIKTLLICSLIVATAGAALGGGVRKRVRFARGSNTAVVKGSVVRGERDTYILGARAGQTMTVRISALEDNAVFQIYRPGGKQTLKGAGEGEDAKEWSGRLPASGNYEIVVGGTRGNATYRLEVKIE